MRTMHFFKELWKSNCLAERLEKKTDKQSLCLDKMASELVDKLDKEVKLSFFSLKTEQDHPVQCRRSTDHKANSFQKHSPSELEG